MSAERLALVYLVLGIVLSNGAALVLLFWHGSARTNAIASAALLGIWMVGPLLLDSSHRIADQALLGSAIMAAMFIVLALPAYFLSLVLARIRVRDGSNRGL